MNPIFSNILKTYNGLALKFVVVRTLPIYTGGKRFLGFGNFGNFFLQSRSREGVFGFSPQKYLTLQAFIAACIDLSSSLHKK